ncbi:MAG TPA: hypothetical protein DCF68_05970 [Cyanothece sp. UBA12306]|nr:hypothetical protein [Cyanothece sp. UBA12306]
MEKFPTHVIISEPHIVVPKTYWHPRLGEILIKADLINFGQLAKVLEDQVKYEGLRLGEILAIRGWVKQGTADFFAEQWLDCLKQPQKERLGDYLQKASLLNAQQINTILAEQQRLRLKFGAVAVLHGWVKPSTLGFFLQHLFPEHQKDSCLTVENNSKSVQNKITNIMAKKTKIRDKSVESWAREAVKMIPSKKFPSRKL